MPGVLKIWPGEQEERGKFKEAGMRKKKILSWILAFFGLLGFAMVYGGAIGADFNPAAYREGITFARVGFIILCLVVVGSFFLNRLPDRPMPISWEKRRRKVFGLKL